MYLCIVGANLWNSSFLQQDDLDEEDDDDLSEIFANMLDDEEAQRQCINHGPISEVHDPVDDGMLSVKVFDPGGRCLSFC